MQLHYIGIFIEVYENRHALNYKSSFKLTATTAHAFNFLVGDYYIIYTYQCMYIQSNYYGM